jgi:hypothetical protein
MDDRVREEMKRENCSADQALYNLKKDDEERRKWGIQLYGKDTWDSRLYDMVLHIDTLTVDDVVEILYSTVRKEQFQTTPEAVKEMKRRTLIANVHAKVVNLSPKVSVRLVDDSVIALGNLEGPLKSDNTIRKEIIQEIQKSYGVKDVIFEHPVKAQKDYVNTFYNLDLD